MTVSTPQQQTADPAMDQALQDLQQSLAQALQLAVAHQQAGQLEEAETLYRTILQTQSNHPEANHSLGVLAMQAKQAEAGLPYFAAALEARPEQQQYWLSYIDALIQADETETAQQVLALGREHGLQGDDMDALAGRLNEGSPNAAQSNARPQSVVAPEPAASQSDKKQTKLKVSPSRKPAWQAALHSGGKRIPSAKKINALMALYGKGRFTEAGVLARSLTTRFPEDGFGWKMLGVVLHLQGRGGEALAPLQKAVELLQTDAELYSTLGVTLQAVGRLAEAEASYRQALKIKPDYAEAHSNLGILLKDLGRLSEAEASYRQALKIKPNFAVAHNNLGNVLQDLGRLAEAEASYRRALKIKPAYVEAHNNLGSLLQVQGRLTEAETSLRQALALKPSYAEAHSNLLFCLSQNEAVDAAALFAEHCRFAAQFEAPLRSQWQPHSNSREPERRLQVGFVSGDLRDHAVASFIEPVLVHLSAYASLSLHAYANHRRDDHVTQRLRGYVQHWHPVAGLSDAALAEKIRADGIDILFDLSNHTSHNRLLSFARKPAPVQMSWIGYHGTTGLSSMDYYLTDRFFLPPGQFDHQFTEKLVHLPAYAPFLPSAEAPPVNDLPALGNGYLTFGSFNRPSKISRAVIALWSQLLRAVPDARMLLGAMPQDGQYDTLIAWFAEEGIARERLDFHPHSDMQNYLALHHQVDVCLDTFPYAGGTTTFHALWMGVPTLTLAGSMIAGRTGAGILAHVGLDAFVAPDAAAFVQQGVSLAADFSTLASLRSGLRERFAQSAPGQPALIAASLERALRTMWQRWCAGLPTESFEISMADMTIPTPLQQAADPAMAQALQDLQQSLAQALQLAVAHQQAGQLEEAETLYRTILQTQPNHPEANHSLGVLAVQANQAEAGLPYFAAALEARPEQQQYWLSYIDALIQADETETAKQVLALGREHGLQGDDMDALAGRLNESSPNAAQSNALAQSVKPARQAARDSGGKKAPGAKEINEITKFLQGETYRKNESKSIAEKPTKTMLRSRVQEAVGINNAIIIISAGDIPAAVQIAKELPSYIVYIFDSVLEDRVAASGLQNIQLVPWDNCPSYHELDAEAHGLVFGLEAELDLAVRTIVPDVSIAAWQHLNLYYIFLILKWYDALWSELAAKLRDSRVHVFICDTPAEYYFNSFIPSHLLLCHLNKHKINYTSYTYGKKSENTYLVPCLSGVADNNHLDQIMIHLPTCMYDINYFNQEIGATGKALVNIESKYWNLPVSSHKNISLVNVEDMFLKLLKPLQYKINTFTHQLEKTLFKFFKPFIGVQTYRARQTQHISQLYRAQLIIYHQLNQYFEASKPSKILLSDHDTGFHGPIISFAEKHSLPVILLPHSKMTYDISFKYRNIMALTHPMQVQEIFDANGKSVLYSRLIYPETFSSSSMATDGMRTISLVLNALSVHGIYINRCADYLNGIRLIVAWCKENNINLKIRFKPGFSLISLFARDIGADVNMLSHQNETMEEHLKGCDLCLMYGVPTTGALHFLRNSIPILNPTLGPLSSTEMALVNPDVISPESVDATLLRLNSFKSDPMKFLSFRMNQFRNYICQFQSAQPLRTYL